MSAPLQHRLHYPSFPPPRLNDERSAPNVRESSPRSPFPSSSTQPHPPSRRLAVSDQYSLQPSRHALAERRDASAVSRRGSPRPLPLHRRALDERRRQLGDRTQPGD